jgi:hypothetical protein
MMVFLLKLGWGEVPPLVLQLGCLCLITTGVQYFAGQGCGMI